MEDAADEIQLRSLELKLGAQRPPLPETPSTSPRAPSQGGNGMPEERRAHLQQTEEAGVPGHSDTSGKGGARDMPALSETSRQGARDTTGYSGIQHGGFSGAQDGAWGAQGTGDSSGIGVTELWLPCLLSLAQAAEYR